MTIDRPALQVKRLDPGAVMPSYALEGDAGLDLRSTEDLTIPPGERASVGTGIAVAIPEGWAGLVVPRSGLAAKHGISLVNSPGLIDSGYRGEIRCLLVNLDPREPFVVERGDRIAQLVLQPAPQARIEEVEDLPASARAEGGFGSTGR